MGRRRGIQEPSRLSLTSAAGPDANLAATTYKQSFFCDGKLTPQRPGEKPAGKTSVEVCGKNDVTHTLATKRTFPMRIYHPSDVIVPNGIAADPAYDTTYSYLGQVGGGDGRNAAGKPMMYYTSGEILGYTNTGMPQVDRQPASNAMNYEEGSALFPDNFVSDFSTNTKSSFPLRSGPEVQMAQSAKSAGRSLRTPDSLKKKANVREFGGHKLQRCIAPDGDVLHGNTTNNSCLAGDGALRKMCSRTAQKPRNNDNFSHRQEQEKKWRQALSDTSSKANSGVSTLPAGFQSSKWLERNQLQACYGPQMQALFEHDVKKGRLTGSDLIVPQADADEALLTTAGQSYVNPYNRPVGSEASHVSGFSQAPPRSARSSSGPPSVPPARSVRSTSEVSHASVFSQQPDPASFGSWHPAFTGNWQDDVHGAVIPPAY